MLNAISLMGRLVKDPELRYTQSETPVCSFTIAVDRDFAREGEAKADFIQCVAWKSTGEFVSKYFAKGRLISLRGTLQSRKWTDRDGNKRESWEVIVDKAYFCGDKPIEKTDVGEKPVFEELDDYGELPY